MLIEISRKFFGKVFAAFLLVIVLGICFSFDFVKRRIPLCEAPTLAEANIHSLEPLPLKPSLPDEESRPLFSLFAPGGEETDIQEETAIDFSPDQIILYNGWNSSSQGIAFWNPQSPGEEFSLELGSVFVDSLRLPKLEEDLEEIDLVLLSQEYCKYTGRDSCIKEDFLELIRIRGQKEHPTFQPSPWPTHGWISSPFGYRISPFTGRRVFHKGLDIATRTGTPIYAVSQGIVTFSGRKGEYGNLIIIQHVFGFSTLYGHNSINVVKSGDRVKCGQLIGYVGNTGRSTAPHLHYEIKKDGQCLNPRKYLLAKLF
ncbi:MAG: M23 family metallopeptidase [bacterium]